MSGCTLLVGDRVVLVATGGTPDAEYALFDQGEIELHATEPGTIREIGYRTDVGEARARLADEGVTPALAEEAAAAAKPAIARAYARGAAVRCIADHLEAAELFEGRVFDSSTSSYSGGWLDLRSLGEDLRLEGAAALMQSMHLAALLAELPNDVPIVLSTAEVTAERRPGLRTYKRRALADPQELASALRALKPQRERAGSGTGPGRQEIVAWLRERAGPDSPARARFAAIEAALGAREREVPVRGPLADKDLWTIESKLSTGDATGILEQLDAIEKRRGRLPGTTYLRARAALMTGTEDARVIAERVSALSTSMAAFHELELLAAQAWTAAGDARRARAFARDLLDNATASDSIRMRALEVLDSNGPGSSAAIPAIPRAPLPPSGTELDAAPRSIPPGTSLPAYRSEPRGDRAWSAPPPHEVDFERVETLALPPGALADPPPLGELPRTPADARLVFTYLARELARALRERFGVELRSDVDGLEIAQRYLRETLVDGRVRSADEERELMRHVAFLSELLARRLGARWVDLEGEPGRWAMLVPARTRFDEVTRVWPIGRTLRFVAMGHRERDLVSYYLELEARAR